MISWTLIPKAMLFSGFTGSDPPPARTSPTSPLAKPSCDPAVPGQGGKPTPGKGGALSVVSSEPEAAEARGT